MATSTRRVERARRTLNVFALLGFVFAFVMPLLGLIFGIIGSVQIGDQPDRYHGQSLAVLGILISVLWPVALFLIFFASL